MQGFLLSRWLSFGIHGLLNFYWERVKYRGNREFFQWIDSGFTALIGSFLDNGSINVENILGPVRISTHNGGMDCYGVSGRIHATTHNGSVKIHYADSALDPMDTMVSTHNGSIEIKAPEKLSTMLSASTHNGKINVNRQVTVSGVIDKNNLNGRIGSGTGDMHLKTHNGAITIR